MNDIDILATGELSAALLADQNFSTILGQYELTIAADLLATAPHETKKREHLYATLWGARGLLNYMKLSADAAASIKAPKAPPQEGVTDYYVEEIYDDEGFLRTDENED